MKNKILVFSLLSIIILCCVLLFSASVRSYLPGPVHYMGKKLYAVSICNPICSFSDGLKGIGHQEEFFEFAGSYQTKINLEQKDADGFERWATPNGTFWIPPGFTTEILSYCLAELDFGSYGDELFDIQKGEIVLDCGANVGVYTRKALDAGARLVVAIEPSPNNIECLRRNFKTEIEEGSVIVYEKGVWDRDDVLKFHMSASSTSDSFVRETPKEIKTVLIPVTTIDNLVKELKLPRVDFIKMDIEGAEIQALRGAKETIINNTPRMAIGTEHTDDFLENSRQVLDIVKEFNPHYKTKCGACDMDKNGYIAPESLLFF